MRIFEQPYWDLIQAEMWVVFRIPDLIEDSIPPKNQQSSLILMYPSMHNHKQVGGRRDLFQALQSGRLISYGRRSSGISEFQEIPSIEWSDLMLDPPIAYIRDPQKGKVEPWTEIRVKSAEVKKLWRSTLEKQSRSKFDWHDIGELFADLRNKNSEMSQNELINETQLVYQERFKKDPPSVTSFKRHIKTWV